MIIATILGNPFLLLGVMGGIGGFYIGDSYEIAVYGFFIGVIVGYGLFEGNR